MNASKTFEVVDQALDLLIELAKRLDARSDFGWHFSRYRAYAKALFDRSPIKKGARVRLTKTPKISKTESWGWVGSEHFLVEGAMATVAEVDFADGLFSAGLIFDEESWIPTLEPSRGPQPVDRKAQYWFTENWFEVVQEPGGVS